MVWGVILFVVFAAVVSWLIYVSSPPPPDDALAIRLAADLGATSPSLVEEGAAQWWWFTLPSDRRTDVLVAGRTVRLRRMSTTPVTHEATLLPSPLLGRDQEMYANRTLIPTDDGGLAIGGHPNASLEGWELRLNATIVESMRSLGVRYVRVEHDQLRAGVEVTEPLDAAAILDVAELLRGLEEILTRQLH